MILFGLNTPAPESARALVEGLLAKNPQPSQRDLVAFLKLLSGDERDIAVRMLVELGVSPVAVAAARTEIGAAQRSQWKTYATLAAAGAAGFHGYRRNSSLFWGVSWFVLGSLFPIVTNVVALAQGFGAPRKAA